jgi:tetratricopeptide (TPR) repeat protein
MQTDCRPGAIDVFISFAGGDRERAVVLHRRLTAAGFLIWFDQTRLELGAHWLKEIDEACEAAHVMLPLITPRWSSSEWTRYETYGHRAILPLLVEGDPDETLTPPLRHLYTIPFDPLTASEAEWQALFAAIRRKIVEPVPENAHRFIDLPYPANPFFTGREKDLIRVHETLHAAPVAALTHGKVSALAALGGIGKTTLANEYARRYWRLYPQILWVDARRGYEAEFARLFDLLFPEHALAQATPAEKARHLLVMLNGEGERLLVIDNANDVATVWPWLPREPTSGCRTLITSRFADWPAQAGIRSVGLDVFDSDSARDFLINRTGRSAEGDERTACAVLADELGYLPLALEQAGAYIAATPGVGFADYRRFYADASEKLLAAGYSGSTDYPEPVLRTWRTTIGKLSFEARAVLWLCAWYAATPIPRALILEGADEVVELAEHFGPMLPLGGAATGDERRMLDALAGLRRYSMIFFDEDGANFRLHGLVQAVERMDLARDGRDGAARGWALERLAAFFPDSAEDPSLWPLCRRLLPHQYGLMEHLGDGYRNPTLSDLRERAGRFLLAAGAAREALPLFDHVLQDREQVLGPGHSRTMSALHKLALSLVSIGDALIALPLYRWLLDSCELMLGRDHPDTLGSLDNLAYCLHSLGDAAAALPLHRRALEAYERVLGRDHPYTATSANNLATCMEELGDAAAALPIYRRVLDAFEHMFGSDDPRTLSVVNNLALCLQSLGDVAAALPLHRRAFEDSERVLGKDHPSTLTSENNLGFCLQTLGDEAGALPLLRHARDASERVLGRDHPDTLRNLNNLGLCLLALGDAAAALPLLRHAFDASEREFGKEHARTLMALNNLGRCLQARGDAEAALPLHRRALDASERVLGWDHPDTLRNLNNLGLCLLALGDAAAALPLSRCALDAGERVLGKDHPSTLDSVNNVGLCLQALGDAEAALPLHRRALEGAKGALGEQHPTTLLFKGSLANCAPVGPAVAPTADDVVDDPASTTGTGDAASLTRLYEEAAALEKRGSAAEALPLFERGLNDCERILGVNNSLTQRFRNMLALCRWAVRDYLRR